MQEYSAYTSCVIQQDECIRPVLRRRLPTVTSDGSFHELHCCIAAVRIYVILVTLKLFTGVNLVFLL